MSRAYCCGSTDPSIQTLCNDCSEPTCSECAAFYDQDVGRDEDVITRAYCKSCWAEYHADSQVSYP